MSKQTNNIPILKITNQDVSTYEKVFDKLTHFKQETTTSSNVEHMKKTLKQSISLWKDLLTIADNVNHENRVQFDENIIQLVQIYVHSDTAGLLKNDGHFSKEIFFAYLDLLNTNEIHDILLSTSSFKLQNPVRIIIIRIVITTLVNLCAYAFLAVDDFNDNYYSLFNAMRFHVDKNLQKSIPSEHNTNSSPESICERILVFVWNLSDRTHLVPFLLHTKFGERIIEWLNSPNLNDVLRRPMVSIVHNISRHDDGADELNKYGAIQTINALQQLESVRQSEMLLITTMALALLSTPEQIKNDLRGSKIILNQLLEIILNAANAKNYRYNNFHVSEPLAVFVKLFVDDTTFDYVINHAETKPPTNSTSTIKLISSLLVKFRSTLENQNRPEQFTFIALFNILWSISFHDSFHDILKQNTELINIIKNVAQHDHQIIIEQYVSRSMQSIKKAADGILFNLGFETPVAQPSVVTRQKPLIMISYSHANNEFCDQILEILDERVDLFDIWIDKRYCKSSDDVWESIAKGIKNAQLIICIVSKEYLESKSCRQEIIYAKDRLNKRFLPVFIEKPDVSDWLDIRIAEFKYVRFQNTYSKLNEKKVKEFLVTVVETISLEPGKENNISIQHYHGSSKEEKIQSKKYLTSSQPMGVVDTKNQSILKWTENDIEHWFEQHKISREIRDLYQFKTGAQMITYSECLIDGWQKQYERYAIRYAKRYPRQELLEHEFALFVSELEQLLYDYNPSMKFTKQQISNEKTSNSAQKSSLCVLF